MRYIIIFMLILTLLPAMEVIQVDIREADKYVHFEKEDFFYEDDIEFSVIDTEGQSVEAYLLTREKVHLKKTEVPIEDIYNKSDFAKAHTYFLKAKELQEGAYKMKIILSNTSAGKVYEINESICVIIKLKDEVQKQYKKLTDIAESKTKKLAGTAPNSINSIYLYNAKMLLDSIKSHIGMNKYSFLSEAQEYLRQAETYLNLINKKEPGLPTGFCSLKYKSAITGENNSFEVINPFETDKKKRKEKAEYKLIYFLTENGIDLNRLDVKDNKYVLIKAGIPAIDSKFSKENKQQFEELSSIIERTISVDKKRIYLVSTAESTAALRYFLYSPSKYAAISIVESSGLHDKDLVDDVKSRLQEDNFPNMLSLKSSSKLTQDGENVTDFSYLAKTLEDKKHSIKAVTIDKQPIADNLSVVRDYFDKHSLGDIPREISIETFDLEEYSSSYYVTIDALEDKGKVGKLSLKVKNNEVRITMDNIKEFTIDLTYPVFDRMSSLDIFINNSVAYSGTPESSATIQFLTGGVRHLVR